MGITEQLWHIATHYLPWWFVLSGLGLLILAAVLLSAIVIKLLFIRWKFRHIPSPSTSSFIFGHLYEILKEKSKSPRGNYPIDYLIIKWYNEMGDVFVVYLFLDALVMVLNPKDVQAIYTNPTYRRDKKTLEKLRYHFGERFLGNALFAIYDPDHWTITRQRYAKVFDKDFVQCLVPRFCECMSALVKGLKPLADGQTEIDMRKFIFKVAMDFANKVMFTYDFDKDWGNKPLGMKYTKEQNIYSISGAVLEGLAASTNQLFFQYMHPTKTERYREALRALRMVGNDCIQKRIKAMENGQDVPDDILTRSLKLASAEEAADIEQHIDHFVSFHSADAVPISSVTSYAMVHTCQDPDILQQLVQEVDEVLGKKTAITIHDLNKMQYTDQVIEEAHRLYSPTGPVPRESSPEGVTLSGGYYIPPGTTIATSKGALCRIPQYYEDPDIFKPSRFSPEKRPGPNIFFPFGIGPRSCVAKHLAPLLMKIIIAQLFQAYDIKLAPGYKPEAIKTLAKFPLDDIPCTITARK